MGGQIHMSLSRIQLAQHLDNTYMKAIMLFDVSSISRTDQWLIKYARLKLFQKVQTLFQMGKKDDLVNLLTYLKDNISEMIDLANDPNCFVSISGKVLSEQEVKERWEKLLPEWLQKFMKNTSVWQELEEETKQHKTSHS